MPRLDRVTHWCEVWLACGFLVILEACGGAGTPTAASAPAVQGRTASPVAPPLGVSHHDPVPQPNLPRPAFDLPFNDPAFGTTVVRITDARAQGLPGAFPDYSKRQAWNADESRLLLRTDDGDSVLLDGTSYQLIRRLSDVGGEDVFWHPTDPHTVFFNPDHTLVAADVETGARSEVMRFDGFDFANTRGEGNLSRDGRFYAVVGQSYDPVAQQVAFREILLADLSTRRVTARLSLPAGLQDFDWVSVSPLGRFVVVDYADTDNGRFHGVEVYDASFALVWQKPLGAGHSDLTVDAAGDEVLVMDVYDADQNVTHVRSFRLTDGRETNLLDLSPFFDLHESCRAEQLAGWCLVSTFDGPGRLDPTPASWLPFENEVFALALDGSGTVARLSHHHSRRYTPQTPDADRSVYFAEPHATLSRRGDRVLFGSNWGEGVDQVASVDAYVVRGR